MLIQWNERAAYGPSDRGPNVQVRMLPSPLPAHELRPVVEEKWRTCRRRLHRWSWLGIAIAPIVAGCANRPEQTRSVPANLPLHHPSGIGIEETPVLVGHNYLSGRDWEWEVTRGAELQELLNRRMPAEVDVDPRATQMDVLQQAAGRTLVWIPPLAEPKGEKPSLYSEMIKSRKTVPTIGEYIKSLLTATSEFGIHLPEEAMNPGSEEWCNVAVVTKKHIVIIAVPVP